METLAKVIEDLEYSEKQTLATIGRLFTIRTHSELSDLEAEYIEAVNICLHTVAQIQNKLAAMTINFQMDFQHRLSTIEPADPGGAPNLVTPDPEPETVVKFFDAHL